MLAATALSLGAGEVVVRLLGVAPGFAAIPFGLYVTSADELVHETGRRSRLWRESMARSHLFRLLHRALVQRSEEELAASPPAGDIALDAVREGLTRIGAAAAEHGFEVTVVTVPVLEKLDPDYLYLRLHAEVLALARERGFDTLDLLPVAIADVQREPRALSLPGDPLHPNAEAADLFAKAIAARWSERHGRSVGD